jgi:hypothetical protein
VEADRPVSEEPVTFQTVTWKDKPDGGKTVTQWPGDVRRCSRCRLLMLAGGDEAEHVRWHARVEHAAGDDLPGWERDLLERHAADDQARAAAGLPPRAELPRAVVVQVCQADRHPGPAWILLEPGWWMAPLGVTEPDGLSMQRAIWRDGRMRSWQDAYGLPPLEGVSEECQAGKHDLCYGALDVTAIDDPDVALIACACPRHAAPRKLCWGSLCRVEVR